MRSEASTTWRRRVCVGLLRAVVPLFAGVSPSLRIPALRTDRKRLRIQTGHGVVGLTVTRPLLAGAEMLPVHFNFHGGGFVAGSSRQDDVICRYLAVHAHCAVINVDYGLAPRFPFPQAILQSHEAILRVVGMADALAIDASRLTLGGFSAGGGIAAALSQLAALQKGFQPRLQILAYPALDFSWTERAFPAAVPGTKASGLTPGMMDFFREVYLPNAEDRSHPLASPVLAAHLNRMPETLLFVGDRDPLKETCRRFAHRCRQARVPLRYREFPDADHGFTHSGPKQAAWDALHLMTYALQQAFDTSDTADTADTSDAHAAVGEARRA